MHLCFSLYRSIHINYMKIHLLLLLLLVFSAQSPVVITDGWNISSTIKLLLFSYAFVVFFGYIFDFSYFLSTFPVRNDVIHTHVYSQCQHIHTESQLQPKSRITHIYRPIIQRSFRSRSGCVNISLKIDFKLSVFLSFYLFFPWLETKSTSFQICSVSHPLHILPFFADRKYI